MTVLLLLPIHSAWAGGPPPGADQDGAAGAVAAHPKGVQFSNPRTIRYRVGVQVRTGSAPFTSVVATFPVPGQWPEQQAQLIDQQVAAEARTTDFRDLNGVYQAVFRIRSLPANQLHHFVLTYDVTVYQIDPPPDSRIFLIPRRPPSEVNRHLASTNYINHRFPQLRRQVNELVEGHSTAWEQVEAIYDWVRDNIQLAEDEEPVGAAMAFRSNSGSPEDLVYVFVAMCRAHRVPARVVWLDGHEYAEFYLEDDEGTGHWFPAELSGDRDFGRMSQPHVIWQKGDNIRVPEEDRNMRYVPEFVTGQFRGTQPRVGTVREIISH